MNTTKPIPASCNGACCVDGDRCQCTSQLGHPNERTYTRTQLLSAIEAERHACSIAVWMTLQDALADGADDKGLDGWMREAECRVKNRSVNDPDVRALWAAVDLRNPWRASLENCISGDNYLRASEYRDLIMELDDLYRLRAVFGSPASA
jgi:hypothetical protein